MSFEVKMFLPAIGLSHHVILEKILLELELYGRMCVLVCVCGYICTHTYTYIYTRTYVHATVHTYIYIVR